MFVSDPTFSFYIHYPDIPFDKKIKTPDGNVGFSIIVPTSEGHKSEEEKLGVIDFGRYMIEQAETGAVGGCDLIVECPLLVTLEQEIDSKVIGQYKGYNDYVHKIAKRGEPKGATQQVDIEKQQNGDTSPMPPKHHEEIFKICRKYLKRFLLSLREKGNVCRLKFYDYNQPEQEFFSGIFGKYYFGFQLQDAAGGLLFDWKPLGLLMRGERPKNTFLVTKRIAKPRKREERLIDLKIWENICGDVICEFQPDLARTFWLDSQDEAMSGNLSMAIVCAAIACEIFTDRFISNRASQVGNKFYDYIVDKVQTISVLELLDVSLESLVGYSVRKKNGELWKDLGKLFQTRNKVVHLGECYYISQSGKTKTLVDGKKTMYFIERVYELFEILDGLPNER